MRISAKFILHTLVVAVSTVVITGVLLGIITYFNAKRSLEQVTWERFTAMRDLKAEQVRQYFDTVGKQLVVYANNLMIADATKKFTAALNNYAEQAVISNSDEYKSSVIKHYVDEFAKEYARLNGNEKINANELISLLNETSIALQYNYILKNPYKVGEKSKLDYVADGTDYSNEHRIFHPIIRDYQQNIGLYDIFLVDSTTGRIVYSVAKELDFTTNLLSGSYANSGIGRVFQRANAATEKGHIAIEDFSPYLPSYNMPAAFIAAPIFDVNDLKIGVIIFQLSIDVINSIMTSNERWEDVGFGKTGESYLIGPDYKMRSMSRFFVEEPEAYLKQMKKIGLSDQTVASMAAKRTNIGLQPVTTTAAKEVIAGKTGIIDYHDYRKVRALSAYEPLNIAGLNWGLIAGIDADEALAPVAQLAKRIIKDSLLIMIIISVISVVIGGFLSRQLSVPIERLCATIRLIAKRQDLTKRIVVETTDEIGDIAKATNGLISSFQEAFQHTMRSSMEMQATADQLKQLAQDFAPSGVRSDLGVAAPASAKQLQLIKESSENLDELTQRLQDLSKQFKFLEDEADRVSGW